MLRTNNDLHTALSLYESNTLISEAFYTPLQCVEVCVRNAIHTSMVNVYGANWFTNGRVSFANDSQKMIDAAIEEVKKTDNRIPDGKIVAQLRFAFWVGLLGKHYDNTLWRGCLHKPFRGKSGNKRTAVHGRLNAIRRFRNRVAHHEPILWRQTPLATTHGEIVEAIGWVCPHTAEWCSHVSRAPELLAAVEEADKAH